jgi:hypothetical protein
METAAISIRGVVVGVDGIAGVEGCHLSGTSGDVMSNQSQRGPPQRPQQRHLILIFGDRVLLGGRASAPAWVFSRARIPAS